MKTWMWMVVGAAAVIAGQLAVQWVKAKWTAWRAKVHPWAMLEARVEALEKQIAAKVEADVAAVKAVL